MDRHITNYLVKTTNNRFCNEFLDRYSHYRNIEQELWESLIPDTIFIDEDENGEPIFVYNEEQPDTYQIISQFKYPQSNSLIEAELHNNTFKSFKIDRDTINYYEDSMQIERYFIPSSEYHDSNVTGYETRCLIILDQGSYAGHVWSFVSPRYPELCGIYGLKSSIMASLSSDPRWKNVARTLLYGIKDFCQRIGATTIVVPWPLPNMVSILRKIGFEEYNIPVDWNGKVNVELYTVIPHRVIDAYSFLSPYTSTSNVFMGNISLIDNLDLPIEYINC